jgi:predicted O-methyltransferase YrrM
LGVQPESGKDATVLPDPNYKPLDGKYQFSKDMFDDRIPVWSRVLADFKGRPELAYLEVGVFEGKSVVWMLENILTDPSARVTAVDIFPGELLATFKKNMELAGRSESVTAIEGMSNVELRKLPLDSYDIIYIDGSHTADDVLADAVLAWGLLKTDGVMIFDDFLWVGRGQGRLLPPELRPALGVAAFVAAYRNEIEILENGYQVILRRVKNPCESKHYCSPIGQLQYLWRERQLIGEDGKPVALAPQELAIIESLANAREFGEAGFRKPADPQVAALLERLGVKLQPAVAPLTHSDRVKLWGVGMRMPPAPSPQPGR